jgi:hypothetical protein
MSHVFTLPASVKLTDRSSFPSWFVQLTFLARAHGVWEYIDPSATDHPKLRAPELPEKIEGDTLRLHAIKQQTHTQLTTKIQLIWNWVVSTVEPQRLQLASLGAASDGSLATLIKELKDELCPSDDDWKEQVLYDYREITMRPQTDRSTAPEDWIQQWSHSYMAAKILRLEAIKGTLPIKDFLRSAMRYQPDWARRELDGLARPGGATAALSLDEYARWFKQLTQDHGRGRIEGVYATLGRSDGYRCPCKKQDTHRWEPSTCGRLEFALTGHTSREFRFKPSSEEIPGIKRRLQEPIYEALRKELRAKGWISESDEQQGIQYPGTIVA